MKITQKTIRQIIKEELEKVLSEDLYASEQEYKEAVEQFMKDNNVSKEEAEKAIDAAGDEMDKEYPMHGRYIEKEKADLKAFEIFMKLARLGRKEYGRNYSMVSDGDANKIINKFKNNLHDFINKHEYYKKIYTGYEFCKNYTLDRYGRFSQAGAAMKKLDKPLLQKDLGAALELSKLEPWLKDELSQRKSDCDENLILALKGAEMQIDLDQSMKSEKIALAKLNKTNVDEREIQAARNKGYSYEEMTQWGETEWYNFHMSGEPYEYR